MVCALLPASKTKLLIIRQPPKLSKSAKQELIVSHLRATRTCHTLKDLEKILPSVASINGIQVKEYVQTLTDENLVRVEKIGSGNWYWCFGSDEKKAREAQLAGVSREVEKVRASYEEVGLRVAEQMARQEQEAANMEGGESGGDEEREGLQRQKQELEKTVQQLEAEWKATTSSSSSSSSSSSKTAQEKKAELESLRQAAEQWTDNIYILEAYLNRLAGGDREMMAAVQQECYGEDYVEGEGLREIL